MGGRLSTPRAADGLNELPKSAPGRLSKSRGIINGRTVMAPLAAFTMAAIVLVYARTSIKAAKLNAQKHREADGGQINWHNENRRRHGQLDKVGSDSANFKEALEADFKSKKKDKNDGEAPTKLERSAGEEKLRKWMGKDD